MFLADSMRLVTAGLADGHPFDGSENLTYFRARCADVLDRFELMAFSRSALEMCADVRIDTPDRLEAVAEVCFARPRQVFIEASYKDRLEAFTRLRGFPHTRLPPGRHEPQRVGLAIDCQGSGRATIGVFWVFPKRVGREQIAAMGQARKGRRGTRLEREAEVEMARFGVSLCTIDVAMQKKGDEGRAEFLARLETPDAQIRELAEAVDRIGAGADVARTWSRARRESEMWRLFRLNQMSTARLDPGAAAAIAEMTAISPQTPDMIFEDAQRDLDGEIMYAIGMLAALEAEGDVLKREARQARPARAGRRVAPSDIGLDRLSVVSLDISDRDLLRSVSEGGLATASKAAGKRVRHPVAGHLFLARNGKMVYRKPHWRGSLIRPRITRVR